jgi:polysaccharide biosynthesis protein PelE
MPAAQSTVAPFVDVLAVGTVRQKHLTLVLISDHFRADFAPALRRALNDNEPAIRVQAATAVARIETRFLERGMALEAAHAGAPDDVDHMAALAAHHADFAATGLLDDERAEATCRQALSLYERCRAHKPDEVSFALAIGRLLLRMKRPAEALDVLEPHAACEDAATDLLLLQAGALFMAGRLVDLRALCARIDARDPQPLADDDPDREALRLWSRGGVA